MPRYRTQFGAAAKFLGGVLAVLATTASVLAQENLPAPKPGQEKPAPQQAAAEKPKRIEVGVELRWRNEIRDNADMRPTEDFDSFVGQRVRLHLRAQFHPHLSGYVQAQDVWLWNAASDKVIHDLATNLHQAFLDWKPGGSRRWELRAGRQELVYGEERLVGAFGWDNVGRSFDAVRVRHRAGAWSSDFLWGRMVDVRRAGAPRRNGKQDLSGAYLARASGDWTRRTELYGLFLRDSLPSRGELGLSPEITRIFTVGFRRAVQPKSGWRYSLEHAWQFGQRGPDAHRALMLVSSVGHVWDTRWQPRLQFEYDFATGDNNPGDGRSREFHNLFPTNHPYYGYADLLGLRNLHGLRLTAAVRPHPKATLEADYHRFLLAAPRGPWRNAGGRVLGFDPTGRAGRELGQEVDLTIRVPWNSHLNFLAGYSVFVPGAFASRTRGPETHHFGYIQTTVRF